MIYFISRHFFFLIFLMFSDNTQLCTIDGDAVVTQDDLHVVKDEYTVDNPLSGVC